MSIFSNPAANFSTAPFVLESSEQNLKIVGVKAKAIDRNDGTQTGIISLSVRIVGGEFDGKPLRPIDCWYVDDGQNTSVMRWVMAAVGIRSGTEDADNLFKSQFGSLDLSFDDSLKPASGWEQVLNSVVSVSVEKKWNAKRDPAQFENRFYNIRPLEA